MKKSLIALAVLAAAGAASAQSSVTLFGIVDATLAYGKANGTGGSNKWQLTNSGYNSSRLGFRGVEDLGGGMSASFWLEAGLTNDDGTGAATNTNNQSSGLGAVVNGRQGLTFNRRSTVSLAGGWGELRLGRDYTPQFWNHTIFDPFGTNGVGTNQIFVSEAGGLYPAGIGSSGPVVRASNSIGYFLPGNLGGFYGQAQYYMGENASNAAGGTKNDGNGFGVRLGWGNGPINVALALSETKYASLVPGGYSKVQQNNIAGQYDFGMAKLMGEYAWDKNGTAKGKGWLIGGLFPVGAGEIRASYSAYKFDMAGPDPKTDKFALGYVHNLSKRTAIYTTFAWAKNKDGAAGSLNGSAFGPGVVNQNSSGWDLGIRHSF